MPPFRPSSSACPSSSARLSTAQPDAHFQPYALPVIYCASITAQGNCVPLNTYLVTFPTQRKKLRFVLFLRDFCAARRRADWAAIPGESHFARAMEYAAFHRCAVYDLAVKTVPPAGSGGGKKKACTDCEQEEKDAADCHDSWEEVVDQDMKTFLTG